MEKQVQILNKRGQELSGIFSIPNKSERLPAVIILQGFLGKKDGEKIASLSRYLVTKGMATIRFDYAGYGESEGKIGQDYMITKILEDLDCIYEFLKDQPEINETKIGMWGQSMGGMLAILYASQNPKISAICVISCPAQITIDDDLEKLVPEWRSKGYLERRNTGGNLVKIPYSFVEDARKWDASRIVKELRVPILVMLGKNDETVFPENTRRIFSEANKPKQLIEIDNMPHDYKVQSKLIETVNEISGDFFIKFFSNN